MNGGVIELKKILKKRINNSGEVIYQCLWKNGNVTWEPPKNLTNCSQAIEIFN